MSRSSPALTTVCLFSFLALALVSGASDGRTDCPIAPGLGPRAPVEDFLVPGTEDLLPAPSAVPRGFAAPTLAAERRPLELEGFPSERTGRLNLALARWVLVEVVMPPGLPTGDRPTLLVVAKRTSTKLTTLQQVRIARSVTPSGDPDDFIPRSNVWSERSLPSDGCTRIALPAAAADGVVFLRSRYLHLPPLRVERGTDSVVLEPVLGGCVTGRCVFPDGAYLRGVSPEDVSIEVRKIASREGALDQRRLTCSRGFRFEFAALAPDCEYEIIARAPGFPPARSVLSVAPGRRRKVQLEFELGGILSGHVVDEQGMPVAGASVRVEGCSLASWTGADGSFSLSAVPAGRVTLLASSALGGSAHASIELPDGWRLPGLYLVLKQDTSRLTRGSCVVETTSPR